MYLIPDMIDMGLSESEDWPTLYHRQVAINLFIGNPNVNTRTELQTGVNKIIKIPNNKIKQITIEDLKDYNFHVGVMVYP